MNIKQVLNDYVDACELVRETEDDIAELEQKQSVVTSDKVKGSMNEHPYTQQSFNIEGLAYDEKRNERLTKEKDILFKRREKANSVRLQALEVINQAPIRIQRIIRFRYEKKLTWEEVADRMKGSIVIATNEGEPLVGSDTQAGKAFANICHRVLGEEVPIMEFEAESILKKIANLFKRGY